MNLADQIQGAEKAITTKNILRGNGAATLIKIQEGELLNKHQSRTDAVLVLLSGKALYEETERTVALSNPHDFVEIPAKVTHQLSANETALLLLIQ